VTVDLTKLKGPQRRELQMGMQVEEKTDETLTFSFSSEAPVDRWFGREILLHEEGAMDLSRLNDGAPWLWNHERNTVLGVVEKAWLGDDRRLYSTVKWSPNTTERGTEEYKRRNDIEAGITRNVAANRAAETPGQTVGTFADGGALVGTNRLDAQFIDLIRNRSAFLNSGLTMLSGLEGNVEIPKKLGSSTYYFVGENIDVTNSKLAFGLVNMIPRTIGVRVPVSRRAMLQSSPDIENLVRLDISESVALGMDYTIGYGTGNNGQPLGIINTAGIGSVTFAGGTNKKFPASLGGDGSSDLNCGDWGDYVDLETELAIDNLDAGSMRYVMNSVVRGALKQTLRASSAGSDYIMTDAGQVNGYQVTVSNQMQTNDVLFGNFADCVVGMWSGLDLIVDPYTQSASGQSIITVHQDFDVAVRRPQSFALGT
jgi:HK97 family phage major capsid protein